MMDSVSSFAELLALSWNYICSVFSFVAIRNEGTAIIKRRWGKPIKVYDMKERWAWKWPIADRFDVVDIRKQIIYLNAHSIKNYDDKGYILPLNTIIDAQTEFRIVNPNVIYKISDDIVKYDENNYTTTESFVDNSVQLMISNIVKNNSKLTNENIQDLVNKELEKYNKDRPTTFCKEMDAEIADSILIENIVIVSFDNCISLRNTE